jgi:ABC-2 type transport system ATP-binding protein
MVEWWKKGVFMEDIVLQTTNLSKSYSAKVLNEVSLTIHRGDIYGFVGRNGAGKTTLMRIIAGLTLKSSGSFSLFGIADTDEKIDLSRRRMSVMIEEAALYPNLDARQNINARMVLMGLKPTGGKELLAQVGLDPFSPMPVKNFSLGMRQRLAIAIALVGNPEFLVLDEPINGLDPAGIMHIRSVLQQLNRERGVTVLISSHILSELSKLTNRFGFIEGGKLLKEVSAEELESSCTGGIRFQVSDVSRAVSYFQGLNIPVLATYRDAVDVNTEQQGVPLAVGLTEMGVSVYGFQNITGDLEGYFMNLIGGSHV